jgi:DUF4097 and DUF4098 domain-containing protein YvlB
MSLLALLTAVTLAPPMTPASMHLDAPVLDTVVDLRRGERVILRDVSGTVHVEAVSGDRLEVTSAGRTDDVTLRRADGRVTVSAIGRGGSRRSVDIRLRVPTWADVELDGVDLDVSVRGMEGSVTIGSVSGDIAVQGTAGTVRARTLEGEIVAESTTGPLYLSSHSDDVYVRSASGPLEVQSLDGDLYLEGLRAQTVRAETQAGDVTFSGEILAGGSYRFYLHDGDARLELPANLSATVRVSTFHGTFESDFPVMVSGFTSGRPFEFTVGGGEAEVRVEVFDGEIRLVKGN